MAGGARASSAAGTGGSSIRISGGLASTTTNDVPEDAGRVAKQPSSGEWRWLGWLASGSNSAALDFSAVLGYVVKPACSVTEMGPKTRIDPAYSRAGFEEAKQISWGLLERPGQRLAVSCVYEPGLRKGAADGKSRQQKAEPRPVWREIR
ncbi:uncharacterized protein PG998_001669 [Apiospora kogelbergensis]|uniref:Uncharacterized protein n=1 Tax=Apiospora kogelbergensis TaxID=1337665 RepID=A0AAW0QSQ4_9PEZI